MMKDYWSTKMTVIILLAGVIVFFGIFIYHYNNLLGDNSHTQKESEMKDAVKSDTSLGYIAYTNGEVTKKLNNHMVQVSVNGKISRLVLNKDVYNSVSPGDMISCAVYLDKDNNVIGINYVAE